MENGDPTRARIVEAAIRLLGEEGPDSLSAAALAREAGISKANVFHHFPRVEEIPQAAFQELAQRLIAGWASPAGSALIPWLQELGSTTLTAVTENRAFFNAYFVFYSKALFDERLIPPLRQCLEHAQAVIESRLRHDFRREDASVIAALAVTVLDGLVMRLLALDDRDAADRMWSSFVELVASRKEQS